MLSRWEEFLSKIKLNPGEAGDASVVRNNFPFAKFFENAPQPLFKENSYAEDLDVAEGCFRHIKKIFTQLEVCKRVN